MRSFALLFALVFAAAHTIPSALTARAKLTKTIVEERDGETWTTFSPDWPTCGNDWRLTDTVILPEHPNNVTVRPDCDQVIDIICMAADREACRPKEIQQMTSISHTVGTCQGHLIVQYPKIALGSLFGYDLCVTGFQGITETCMLVDDPSVGKNWASWEHQAGAMNVVEHHPVGTPTSSTWAAATEYGDYGYMMGPVGYFGNIPSRDAGDVPAYSRQGPTAFTGVASE